MNSYKLHIEREDESARLRRVKEYAENEARKYANRIITDYTRRFDALMLLTLHTEFGFGRERLERFYRAMDEEYKRLTSMLGAEDTADDVHYWAWERRLKECTGLDLDELFAKYENEKG